MFFEFGIKDVVDIVLVALMLFYIYRLMKESRSLNVFMGILIFRRPMAVGVAGAGDEAAG